MDNGTRFRKTGTNWYHSTAPVYRPVLSKYSFKLELILIYPLIYLLFFTTILRQRQPKSKTVQWRRTTIQEVLNKE
jgi:hypothetical protein